MTNTDFNTPTARSAITAARALGIPDHLIIDALMTEQGALVNENYGFLPRERLWLIVLPFMGQDDAFDETIHEITHLIPGMILECEECDSGECDVCCRCWE